VCNLRAVTLVVAAIAGAAGCSGVQIKAAMRQEINAHLHSRRPAMVECYRAALERDRKLSGALTLKLRFEAGSREAGPVQLAAGRTLVDDELGRCVLSRVGTVRVSESLPRTVEVTYPLSFSPL